MTAATFPDGFVWGTATAAHQVEGGNWNNDWWAWEHTEGSPCEEPSGDAAQLDVGSYGAFFDCTNSRWSFGVDTYDAWPDSSLAEYDIWIGGSSGGCNGFQWLLQARYASGALTSELWAVTSAADWNRPQVFFR